MNCYEENEVSEFQQISMKTTTLYRPVGPEESGNE